MLHRARERTNWSKRKGVFYMLILCACLPDVDECITSPCLNDATCVNREQGFLCQCTEFTTGLLCEEGIQDLCRQFCLCATCK